MGCLILIPTVAYIMYYTTILILDIADENDYNCHDLTEFVVLTLGESSRIIVVFLIFSLQVHIYSVNH